MTVGSSLAPAGIADRQAEFAATFCQHYARLAPPADGGCARWLPEAAGAAAAMRVQETAIPPGQGERPVVVIVPGIFGECVSRWVTPFSADYRYLEQLGYQVLVVLVTGRGSSMVNAAIIHSFFAEHAFERAVVIAYSKGVTDFMQAAAQPQGGQWAGLPIPSCAPSDRGGVESLTYRSALPVAQAFANAHPPYPRFSIAAVADSSAVNPVLQPFHALLAQLDRRNDGQVLLEDTVVPGSAFLATFRADHWSIVLPLENSDAPAMQLFDLNNHFPRRTLITALLDFVNH